MSTTLLLQDAAVRALPRWIAIAAGVGLTVLGLIVNIAVFLRVKQGDSFSEAAAVALFSLVMWTSAAAFLATAAFRVRCSPFVLTLPLGIRRLWLTHCVGVALVGLVVSSVMTAIGVGVLWGMAQITKQPMLLEWGAVVQLGVAVLATFVLATAVLQKRSLGLSELRWNRRFMWMVATALVVGWGLVALLATLPLALLLVPVAATTLLGAHALRTLPAALTSHPLPEHGDGASSAAAAQAGTTARPPNTELAADWSTHAAGRYGFLHLATLFLVAINRAAPKTVATVIFGIPGMLFFGMILAGTFDAFDDDGSAAFRWISIPLTVYMLLAVFAKPLKGIQLLDHLPVSRRFLFTLMTVPSLALLALGYGAGRIVVDRYAPDRDVDLRVVTSNCSGVVVPRSLLQIAWDGQPPPIGTPWGESFESWRVPLYRGAHAVAYSPYCSRDTSTTDGFVALQASRASSALYGNRIPETEIRERYLAAGAVEPGLPLRRDYPELRVRARHASLPLLAALVCCGWFAVTAAYMRTFRSGISSRVRKWTLVSLLVFLMVIHLMQFVPFMLEFTEPWIVDAFWEIQARALAEHIPGGTPALWLLGALVVASFYALAERQFARAEFLDRVPGVCSL